jgi:hypothetical protein
MDKLSLLKFICRNDLDYGTSSSELYKAQTYFYSLDQNTINTDFDPLDWLCANANYFFSETKIVYLSNNDKTPISVFYNGECVFHDNLLKQSSLETICNFLNYIIYIKLQ